MADDKKPEKKKSPLYDAPNGEAKHGARAEKKPAEDKPPAKADAKPADDKDPAAKPTAKPADKDPAKPAGDAKPAAEEPKKPPAHEALSGVHKRHETERRDHHGNVREQYRQMASRHEKELKDFHAAHLAELAAGNAPAPGVVPGNEAEKPQAQAIAAAAPAAE
jgi:hypothetical protein